MLLDRSEPTGVFKTVQMNFKMDLFEFRSKMSTDPLAWNKKAAQNSNNQWTTIIICNSNEWWVHKSPDCRGSNTRREHVTPDPIHPKFLFTFKIATTKSLSFNPPLPTFLYFCAHFDFLPLLSHPVPPFSSCSSLRLLGFFVCTSLVRWGMFLAKEEMKMQLLFTVML